MNRILCTTLLLIVFFGYAMGTTHAAVHVTADPGDCTLCATYGSSSEGVPATGLPELPLTSSHDLADPRHAVESSSAVANAHPRGPPLST